MERQTVASAYIISEDKVLLIFHKKLQKWLCPGGHMDPNELPAETAKREALEETGLEIELISDEHIWVDEWNASSIQRPFLCLLEEIPAYGTQPAHQHIDFIYIAKPVSGVETVNSLETDGLRWFTLDEIDTLKIDIEIFAESRRVIHTVFKFMENRQKNELISCNN